MIKPLEHVLERVKTWPEERQRDLARLLDEVEQAGTEVYHLSEDERRLVDVGLDEAKRGAFVSDKAMDVFWNRNKRP